MINIFDMDEKSMKTCGLLALIFGVLFLIQDMTTWDFWGINWWTIVFLLMGLKVFMKAKK